MPKRIAGGGTKLVATRSTGFNQIDVAAAKTLGVKVVRVTNYSPNSVAEFAVGLLLALNRKIPRAYNPEQRLCCSRRRALMLG